MKFRDTFVLCAVVALLTAPIARGLAGWAYEHFDFLKYKPTIVVDRPFNPFEPSATQQGKTPNDRSEDDAAGI
ncbi:hypothetical protein FSG43_022620 [Escherichia coli]|nr:hypothetical protein [Escherichia coli]